MPLDDLPEDGLVSSEDDSGSSSGDDESTGSSIQDRLASLGSSAGGSSGGGGGFRGTGPNWSTKLDFGTSYVIVAEDRQGNFYKHKGSSAVIDEADHWLRLQEADDKDEEEWTQVDEQLKAEYRVIFQKSSKEAWLRFCHLAKDQLGVDPSELLEDDPEKLFEIKDKVHYPPGSKPDKGRTCQVCGKNSEEQGVTMTELDLHKHRKTPVCTSHTIEELAYEGLLK